MAGQHGNGRVAALAAIERRARSLIDGFPDAVRTYRSCCDGPRFAFDSIEAHNQRVLIEEASQSLRRLESELRKLAGQVMSELPDLAKTLRHVTTTSSFLDTDEKVAPVLNELHTIEVEAHRQQDTAASVKTVTPKLVDEGDRTMWTIWVLTKIAHPVFSATKAVGKSPQAWTDFANGLRYEGLMENHPVRGPKEIKIHRSVLAKFEIKRPDWFD